MNMKNDRDILKDAFDAATEKSYVKALDLCETYIGANSESPEAFRTRSHVYGLMGEFSLAIEDRRRAMALAAQEPGDSFFCGWWNLELNQLDAALKDLTKALKLAEGLDSHNFDQSIRFFKSVTLLRMGKYDEALVDLEDVDSDFSIHLRSGAISRSDVLKEAISKR